MLWLAGWPLLLLSLFVGAPYREQLLAGQTILCSMYPRRHHFHVATVVFVVFYFTHPETHIQNMAAEILRHVIVACAVVSHYLAPAYQLPIWTLTAWTTRWLPTASLFDTPLRSLNKCAVFVGVSRGPWRGQAMDTRWSWILFTHEAAWLLLPIQILYEVYFKTKKNTNTVDIV